MERRVAPHLVARSAQASGRSLRHLNAERERPSGDGRTRALRRSIAAFFRRVLAAYRLQVRASWDEALAGVTRLRPIPVQRTLRRAVLMPPGRVPEPPEREVTNLARGRRTTGLVAGALSELVKRSGNPLRGTRRPGGKPASLADNGPLSARSASPPPRVLRRHRRDAPRLGRGDGNIV
jgi:hypothetical protein